MSTLEPKPVKATKALNPTMLTIAAILLIVLALLFLASPLLGLNRGARRAGNFQRQFTGQNGQNLPGGGTNGQPFFQPGREGPEAVTAFQARVEPELVTVSPVRVGPGGS